MSTVPSRSQNAAGPSKSAASTPDKTPSSKHFRGGVVTIVVSSGKTEFTIHKDLLVFYSDYFRAALNGSFVEATEKRIELLDVEEKVFEHFHIWLYTRKLTSDDNEPLEWNALIVLWIFGDRFQVPMLQNCVMDELFAKQEREKQGFRLGPMKRAYEKTVDDSLLRKAIVELVVYKTEFAHAGFDKCSTVEILQDIIKETIAARKNAVAYATAPKRDKCFFHVHGKDEHC